jgi:hypothetical protein
MADVELGKADFRLTWCEWRLVMCESSKPTHLMPAPKTHVMVACASVMGEAIPTLTGFVISEVHCLAQRIPKKAQR